MPGPRLETMNPAGTRSAASHAFPSQLLVLPPAGLTGEQTLINKTLVSGSLRTYTYGVNLAHAPA